MADIGRMLALALFLGAGVGSLALIVYLVYALVHPERL